MYIGYLHDRKKLGFSCIKDVRAAKLISDLKKFLKRTQGVSVGYIVKKGKQTLILIFSKEVLVAVLIFVKSISVNLDSDMYRPSSSSSKVYQSCVSKSNNLGFLTSPSQILDSILKLKGGSDELPDSNKMSYETVNLVDFNRGGFSARPINMETLGSQLSQEYKDYQKDFNSPRLSKRFDTLKFSQVRFQELAKDPNARTEVYHKKTIDEARSALHAEMLGIVNDGKRIPQPYCKSVDLDFGILSPAPFTHLDLKHPVGSSILKKQNSPYTLKEASFNMGRSIVNQKQRFCGLEKGPVSSKNVLHVVDLCYVPKNEKEIVKDLCLKGAGSSEGILFLNTKEKK